MKVVTVATLLGKIDIDIVVVMFSYDFSYDNRNITTNMGIFQKVWQFWTIVVVYNNESCEKWQKMAKNGSATLYLALVK